MTTADRDTMLRRLTADGSHRCCTSESRHVLVEGVIGQSTMI